MAAGPRWMTAGEYENREGDTAIVTVTLNNEQIKALPSTAIILVPPTEVYSNEIGWFPTKLFVPVLIFLNLNAKAGAYTNINSGSFVLWWSSEGARSLTASAHSTITAQPELQAYFLTPEIDALSEFDLTDNALVLRLQNSGDLTDGNDANTLEVVVHYVEWDL